MMHHRFPTSPIPQDEIDRQDAVDHARAAAFDLPILSIAILCIAIILIVSAA